ncbi:MAG: FAD-binding protein [Candidatus Omnitrophica bacterium]|nr:FAD-binding protein [Candidatus Omnitrophota bacterium]
MNKFETYAYDVLVIGSGGAGLRAAVASQESGARTAVISKCLLGKAHTVMAEGGIAASLGHVDENDGWQPHFKDTMFGGKYVNDWRMALIHAKESPEAVRELERWGAVFDRTPDGRILQRAFGGHTHPRLCHVGDRTGLEMIRTLQDRAVAVGIDTFMECIITRLLTDREGAVCGAFGFFKNTGKIVVFRSKAVIIATGGLGKIWRITSNSWDCTADGQALAYEAGAELKDMEFVQFHPTGMVWPPGVKGLLVTEAVRGEGGLLKNKLGERFMKKYDPKRMELSTRDVVARAINQEVKEGRGSEHGGVYLDISHRSAAYVKRKLPSMYQQFKEFADVDITKQPMEVGPTCHYTMGGVRVDHESQQSSVKGLFAAGEAAAGLHGGNRLGGNSLSDLIVFGKRAGMGAAEYARKVQSPAIIEDTTLEQYSRELFLPFERPGGETPAGVHHDLQNIMEAHAGIIRQGSELQEGLEKLKILKTRYPLIHVDGNTRYNFGWHLYLSLANMITVAEIIAKAALERKESRSAQARADFPNMDSAWGKKSIIVTKVNGAPEIRAELLPAMPDEISKLLGDH